MTMTKREKILICIVLILAVLFVYYMYFLQPSMKDLSELNNQKNSKESTLLAYEQIKSSIEDTNKNISDLKNDITQIGGNIMPRFDQPAVLVYLNDTISEFAQKITYDFEEVKDIGQLKVCRVYVTMSSTYEGLKSILKSLEEGEYFAKVVGLETGWSTSDAPSADNNSENAAGPEDTGVTEDTEGSESTALTAPVSAPVSIENRIAVSLTLEFYNLDGELPPDKSYPFADGYFYGGDIFF